MFKKLTVITALLGCFCLSTSAETISNKFFSLTMPDDTKGTYAVDKYDTKLVL